MGCYDTMLAGNKDGQVKLWDNTMREFKIGDSVPSEDRSFSIVMREGGYCNITNGIFVSWTDKPEHPLIFDKYGEPFDSTAPYIEGVHYFFSEFD